MEQELDTRTRLLEAAGPVLAERGFKAATIREIVERAGANLAAVNYHFGDKEGLFVEVLRTAFREALERFPADGGLPADRPVEERFRAAIQNLLMRCLGTCQPERTGRLMAREMAEPTPLLLDALEPLVRPMHEHLASLVREQAGEALPEAQVWLCTTSILAQCVMYHRWEGFGERFHRGLLPPLPERAAFLAEHVTRFSLAALRGYRAEETP